MCTKHKNTGHYSTKADILADLAVYRHHLTDISANHQRTLMLHISHSKNCESECADNTSNVGNMTRWLRQNFHRITQVNPQ